MRGMTVGHEGGVVAEESEHSAREFESVSEFVAWIAGEHARLNGVVVKDLAEYFEEHGRPGPLCRRVVLDGETEQWLVRSLSRRSGGGWGMWDKWLAIEAYLDFCEVKSEVMSRLLNHIRAVADPF